MRPKNSGPTIMDVAQKAYVSKATVSHVLNQTRFVEPETRQRVEQVIADLGYRPNALARSLRTNTTKTIGILVENINSPFIAPIIRGIQDTLKPAGYLGLIVNTDWDEQIEMESLKILNNRQIDGIIFVATWHRDTSLLEQMTRKPYVFVHRHFNSYSPNSVLANDRLNTRLAVGHLADMGHSRIAYISGPADWDASQFRLRGYQEELAARGLPYDEQLVVVGSWEVENGYQAAQQLLTLPAPPTAIFAGNDVIALGAIHGAQDMGLQIPRDLAVVGYDAQEFTSFFRPAITTVRLPCNEMGIASAELLLRLMNGEIQSSEPIEVPGQLIVRESCGARLVR